MPFSLFKAGYVSKLFSNTDSSQGITNNSNKPKRKEEY
jgi:hypothetical protein